MARLRRLGCAAAILVAFACGNSESGFVYKTCQRSGDCTSRLDECRRVQNSIIGVCTVGCETDTDCPPEAECARLEGVGFRRSCVRTCTDDDCPAGLGCFTYDLGRNGCFPTNWF